MVSSTAGREGMHAGGCVTGECRDTGYACCYRFSGNACQRSHAMMVTEGCEVPDRGDAS
jgi:hypothetical protein